MAAMTAALLYNLGAFLVIFIAWPWLLWDKQADGPMVALTLGAAALTFGWLIETLGAHP